MVCCTYVLPPAGTFNIEHSLIACAVSGLCRAYGNLVSFPFDTMTTREEAVDNPLCKGFRTFSRCNAREPISSTTGLYRGVTGMVLSTLPSVALTSMTHDYVDAISGGTRDDTNVWVGPVMNPAWAEEFEWWVASAVSCLPSALITTPTEVLKQRVQAGYQPNIIRAAKAIMRCQGITGFYSPYWALIHRDLSFSLAHACASACLTLLASELRFSAQVRPLDVETFVSATVYVTATAFAAVATQKLDVRKTWLATAVECKTEKLCRMDPDKEGEAELHPLAGLGPRLLALCISSGVFFTLHAALLPNE